MADVPPDRVMLRDTPNYRVSYYRRPARPNVPAQLTIVFVSAGQAAPGEPVEEFKRTLDRMDTSVIFVLDRHAQWFNHDESPEMWAELDAVARTYPRVSTIGESMGGCGAILAHKELGRVDRTLALSPQHSIVKPFVDFDYRYEGVSRQIAIHRNIHFSDAPDPGKCVVLFGNREWRDYIHSSMFIGHGFAPLYMEGADHNVAVFLKQRPGNDLVKLVGALLDWNAPFDRARVAALFPAIASEIGMHPGNSFASEATGHNQTLLANLATDYARLTRQRLGPDLALGRAADQSSVSAWSRAPTTRADAANAVTGQVTGSYSFHTAQEPFPWWSVDLGGPCRIQEIRLFNFIAAQPLMERAARLTIAVSMDGAAWTPVFERHETTAFGGADGFPLIWRPDGPCETRHVRVQLQDTTYLHLDQVQVFGHRIE